jgi:DNA-binding response OmpR family regulator
VTGLRYRNVLVVEDDNVLARIIERNLSARGARVLRVASVGEALAAIAVARPDLMLLDIDLPDRTGWDLLRALQTRDIRIPAIVVSGTRVTPERLAEFKPVAYLPKPFPLDALLRLVIGEEADPLATPGARTATDERFVR